MITSKISFQDLIRTRVPLGRLSGTGFYEQRCAICNDHSNRAGWKIDEQQVFYNCYNCGFHASYSTGNYTFSSWMKKLCYANGITDDELQSICSELFFNRHSSQKEITLQDLKKVNLVTPEVQFPSRTMKLGSSSHDEIQEPIIQYLLKRQVDPAKFYFSLDPAHLNRVIIPFWRDSKLVFWQSRTILNEKPRYKNCSASKDAIIYGFDELYKYSKLPLFCTEGVFDAESINGICIIGSKLSPAKIELLQKTKRRIIFVIDRDSNGGALGAEVVRQGWEITFVDPNADDVNDSIQKFGKLYTLYSLMKNSSKGKDSQLELDLELLDGRLRAKWMKSSPTNQYNSFI